MKLRNGCFSVGDICASRYWFSIERRYFAPWRWHFSTGPTYNGTIAGFCLATPLFVAIGHERLNHARTHL